MRIESVSGKTELVCNSIFFDFFLNFSRKKFSRYTTRADRSSFVVPHNSMLSSSTFSGQKKKQMFSPESPSRPCLCVKQICRFMSKSFPQPWAVGFFGSIRLVSWSTSGRSPTSSLKCGWPAGPKPTIRSWTPTGSLLVQSLSACFWLNFSFGRTTLTTATSSLNLRLNLLYFGWTVTVCIVVL